MLGFSALGLTALGCAAEPVSYETFEDACAAVPGCGESRYPIEGNLEPIYRVLVVRSAEGTFSIAQSERIELVEGDGIPLGPSGGDVLLAGRNASGEPVDGQLIRFPTTRLLESLGEDAFSEEQSLEGEITSAIGYVRALPDVTELALIDLEGNAIAQAPLPVTPPEEEGVSREALRASTSPACAHVRVLDGEADRAWFPRRDWPVERPGPLQLALIDAALSRLPPLLCQGVSRIALVDASALPEADQFRGFVDQGVEGDLVYFNITRIPTLRADILPYSETGLARNIENRVVFQHAITHEVAHTFEALLGAELDAGFTGRETLDARTIARETIDRVRLRGSLRGTWLAMHQSFESVGLAAPFGLLAAGTSPASIAEAGFISRYGSTNAADDIAEMIARPITGPEFERNGLTAVTDGDVSGCVQMRTYTDESVPAEYAALFTKLRFLQDLGVISETDVRWCTGQSLGLRVLSDRGFLIAQGDAAANAFNRDPESTLSGVDYRFQSRGTVMFGDASYDARAILDLEFPSVWGEVGFLRGIYPISAGSVNTFDLAVADQPAASFTVTDGYVLIASATNERIIGSVFANIGFRYDAPFPVPQTFDPPLVISFVDTMPPR